MNVLVSKMTNRTTGGRHPHHGSDKNASSFCTRLMSSGTDETLRIQDLQRLHQESDSENGGEAATGARGKAVENTKSRDERKHRAGNTYFRWCLIGRCSLLPLHHSDGAIVDHHRRKSVTIFSTCR